MNIRTESAARAAGLGVGRITAENPPPPAQTFTSKDWVITVRDPEPAPTVGTCTCPTAWWSVIPPPPCPWCRLRWPAYPHPPAPAPYYFPSPPLTPFWYPAPVTITCAATA